MPRMFARVMGHTRRVIGQYFPGSLGRVTHCMLYRCYRHCTTK